MKIVLSCATAVLFVAMPVAVILWPISELSWVARFAMRSFLVCLLIPLVWLTRPQKASGAAAAEAAAAAH